MMEIELKNVYKVYEKNGLEVVKDFSLKIEDKEFIIFVGPSGCGKSTTLRMIAGLEDITSGEILFNGKVINNIAPGDRNVAMVFQSYALYPHMTVYKNMEFPLKIKKVAKEERNRKILEVAEMLGLTEFLQRKPRNLSGGQRQRVAVGRELVRDVDLFLMDEPLSNLDAKLRVQMRTEITNLHKTLQKTFIYVTHDQVEAMTMADRIVIMKDGIIQQVGTPKEVYDTPANIFVAGFIGTPAMNFINGRINNEGQFEVNNEEKFTFSSNKTAELKHNGLFGKEVILGIRPEDIVSDSRFVSSGNFQTFTVRIKIAELLGSEYNLIFNLGRDQLIARSKAMTIIKNDDEVKLHFDLDECIFFDKETTECIC
ncbi:MAG: ABC transporter ATP-binding protein [Bacilli bacterium]